MDSRSYKENTERMQKAEPQQVVAARKAALKRALKRAQPAGDLPVENTELKDNRNSEAHSDDDEDDDTGDHFKRLEELEAGPSTERHIFDDSREHFRRLEELEAGPVPEKRAPVNYSLPLRREEQNPRPVPVDEKRAYVNYSLPLRNENTPGHAHYNWALRTGIWEDWVDEADWHESKLGFSSSGGNGK